MNKVKIKSKRMLITLLVGVLVFSVIGVTVALLVTNTQTKANAFTTSGKLAMELIEEEWDKNTPEEKLTYPGRTINKDPKVKVLGDIPSYVFIKVKIPRAEVALVTNTSQVNPVAWAELFTYTVNSDWQQVGADKYVDENAYTERVYAYMPGAVDPGEETTTVFDTVSFQHVLEGQLEMGNKVQILVEGMTIQSDNLNITGSTDIEKMASIYQIYSDEFVKE